MPTPNIKIEVEETKTYWRRMRNPLLFLSALPTILLVFGIVEAFHTGNGLPFIGMLFVGMIPYIIVLPFVNAYTKNFITLFEIKDDKVLLEFTERDVKNRIHDSIDNFIFIFKFPGTRGSGLIYPDDLLDIRYKKDNIKVQIIQGNKWGWETHFNEVKDWLDDNKLLEEGYLWFISKRRKYKA